MPNNLLSKLPTIRGEYRENFSLAPITWFKVGGNAEVFFKPLDLEDLIFFLSNTPKDIPITILGACSNVLIRDGGIPGVVIKLGRAFAGIELIQGNHIRCGSAVLNYNTAQFCHQNSIAGFEFLVGIPGTAGGGIAMNAGAYSREFKDIVLCVEAVDRDGALHQISNEGIGFRYRKNSLPEGLIYTSVTLKYTMGEAGAIKSRMDEIVEARLRTQPVKEKTCGSTFANLPGQHVWKLIDEVGMRGAKVGGAEISKLHCNFMINTGDATAADLETLGNLARERVKSQKGLDLEWEIKRLGISK
ncbi:MAG: UDP-N-acetylmuramate dehydrogenase [Pseudomonadota bacterium]